MTVEGKGGRPKKWRSNAERVRAYRARQRGENEPPTLEQAAADGDEFATLLLEVEQLRRDLADSHSRRQRLAAQLRRAQDRVAALGREKEHLLDSLDRVTIERNELRTKNQ